VSDSEWIGPSTAKGFANLEVCAICDAELAGAEHPAIWTHEGRGEAIALCAECDVMAPEGDATLAEFQERALRLLQERVERRRRYAEEHLPEEDDQG
jgi:hypothetical protein